MSIDRGQINLPRILLLTSLVLIHISITSSSQKDADSDEFIDLGIRLTGDNTDALLADLIAEERELFNAGHIRGLDMYHFRLHQRRGARKKRSVEDLLEELRRDERIEFVTIGQVLQREKRDNPFLRDDDDDYIPPRHSGKSSSKSKYFNDADRSSDKKPPKMSFNDPLYPKQWYLENNGQFNTPAGYDLNLVPVWLAGYSGKNVSICIVDDGIQHSHPDLKDCYRPDLSYDLNDLNDPEHDPTPNDKDPSNSHGTRCAGGASGKANNDVCGVGVAHESYCAGIRLLDGPVTTLLEVRALTMFAAETHIKSASWGPRDNGMTMEAPGHFVETALEYGVTEGRHGKGTLFVWASGNGGMQGDDCGADGYVSHHNVLSISSLDHLARSTSFDEYCPSTIASVSVGGRHSRSDTQTLDVGVVAADLHGECTTKFFGTSAAAPIAAGMMALVLEANPDLTYRDVMYIVAETARIPTLLETEGWVINGAGYHVNDRFGFGVLDAGLMIAKAQQWTNVQPRYECHQEYQGKAVALKAGKIARLTLDIEESVNITMIEHVVLNISFQYHRRGDLKITLISPSGTPSEMLSYRKNDDSKQEMEYFPFTSVHHWGEDPIGRWTLQIEALAAELSSYKSDGREMSKDEISYFKLHFYGTHRLEDKIGSHKVKRSAPSRRAYSPEQDEIEYMYHRELEQRSKLEIMDKREYQLFLEQRRAKERREQKPVEQPSLFQRFQRFFGL